MSVIYEPSGRAREYSPLALNLYGGCMFGCLYCYNPAVLHRLPADFHLNADPRPDILSRMKKDCVKMKGDPRPVLFCFTCDPYPSENSWHTRQALEYLEHYEMKVQVLTKNGILPERDFDILARMGRKRAAFGVTLSLWNEAMREKWEPGASPLGLRVDVLAKARAKGIRTWVSVEPVLDPDEALAAIESSMHCADQFRVGKLNARTPELKEIEKSIDWHDFLLRAEKLLHGKPHIIKKDLEAYR